eukprot:scaffold7839_cov124-Alexandrium_tamarense.AAC.1
MTEEQIEEEQSTQQQAWAREQATAAASGSSSSYQQARSGVNQNQYDNTQNEQRAWYYDSRIFGGAAGEGCSSNYGEYMLELEGERLIVTCCLQSRIASSSTLSKRIHLRPIILSPTTRTHRLPRHHG